MIQKRKEGGVNTFDGTSIYKSRHTCKPISVLTTSEPNLGKDIKRKRCNEQSRTIGVRTRLCENADNRPVIHRYAEDRDTEHQQGNEEDRAHTDCISLKTYDCSSVIFVFTRIRHKRAEKIFEEIEIVF